MGGASIGGNVQRTEPISARRNSAKRTRAFHVGIGARHQVAALGQFGSVLIEVALILGPVHIPLVARIHVLQDQPHVFGGFRVFRVKRPDGIVVLFLQFSIFFRILHFVGRLVFGSREIDARVGSHSLRVRREKFGHLNDVVNFQLLEEILAGQVHALVFLHPGFHLRRNV